MNTQFYHQRKDTNHIYEVNCRRELRLAINPRGGKTIALEMIEPWFFDSLKIGDTFEKRVGKARCSEQDNYCKKTGRDLATSRLMLTKFTVSMVVNKDTDQSVIALIDDSGDIYYLRKHRDRVYFEGYDNG